MFLNYSVVVVSVTQFLAWLLNIVVFMHCEKHSKFSQCIDTTTFSLVVVTVPLHKRPHNDPRA